MIFIQSYFIYFYYYIYSCYEIFILIIYISFILKLTYHNLNLSYKYDLAFNINFLSTQNNLQLFENIKQIYISQINNSILNIKSQTFHKLFYFLENNTINLSSYLNLLKLSGFIKSINYAVIIIDNKKYFKLCIQFNPILKTIQICRYNKLLIPSYKLKRIFSHNLGLPINYRLINQAIERIITWYDLQGFKWVQVKLVNTSDLKDLKIIIIEHKLISSKIICMNNFRINNYLYIHNTIKSEIKLLYGDVVNKKKIDNIIRTIKYKYLLDDISYNIVLNNHNAHIIIKYIINKDNSIKIYYYSLFNNLHQYFNKFILNLFKIQEILINKYRLTYITNCKFYINYYYLINIRIVFLNLSIKHFIQSINIYFYHFHRFIYSLNLFFKDNIYNKKLFILYFINLEMKYSYYLNQYMYCIQKIYYLKTTSYTYLINNFYMLSHFNNLIKLYKYKILYQIILYKIRITCDHSNSLFGIIYNILVDCNYYFFLYLNINYNHYNDLFYQYINFSIKNKLILERKFSEWSLGVEINIFQLFINKYKLSNILLTNFSNLRLSFYNPLINLYFNYSFNLNKYNKLYIFTNYSYLLKSCNSIFDKQQNLKLIGIGWEIKLPFKQVPHIRLKYIINIRKQIYLSIDKFNI